MKDLDHISLNPEIMGGKPCIKGTRITVGTIVGLVASGYSNDKIIKLYPTMKQEDIKQALSYAAWRSEEIEVILVI